MLLDSSIRGRFRFLCLLYLSPDELEGVDVSCELGSGGDAGRESVL